MPDPHEKPASERHDRIVRLVCRLILFVFFALFALAFVLALLGPALGNLFMSSGGHF